STAARTARTRSVRGGWIFCALGTVGRTLPDDQLYPGLAAGRLEAPGLAQHLRPDKFTGNGPLLNAPRSPAHQPAMRDNRAMPPESRKELNPLRKIEVRDGSTNATLHSG